MQPSGSAVVPRTVHVVVRSPLPARDVWRQLADWSAPYFGLPVETAGSGIGAVRTMSDASGSYTEVLLGRSEAGMSFSYALKESPLPTTAHSCLVRVCDLAGAGCSVTWDVRSSLEHPALSPRASPQPPHAGSRPGRRAACRTPPTQLANVSSRHPERVVRCIGGTLRARASRSWSRTSLPTLRPSSRPRAAQLRRPARRARARGCKTCVSGPRPRVAGMKTP